MSNSRVFYEPYDLFTGDAIGPVSDYDAAAVAALSEEGYRLAALDEAMWGAETSARLAVAVAKTKCAVRFVRAERSEISR
jgi:hypothetical protein